METKSSVGFRVEAFKLCLALQEAAMEGDTQPELDEDVTPHFVALINHNNRCVDKTVS